MQNFITKYKNVILLTIGIFLIILSICLVSYDKVELIKKNVFDEVLLLQYRENNQEKEKNISSDETEKREEPEINNIEINEIDSEKIEVKEEEKKKIEKEFIGYLEISKINLKQGLVSKKSYYNNVNRNIQILDASDYPDKVKGNTILAAHSGTSSISYFKNLYKLSKGDNAKIYYKGYIYSYTIVDIYDVPKNGSVRINRNMNKTVLTLITCTHNSDTKQTVYILELTSKDKEV